MAQAAIKFPPEELDYIEFTGGLDVVTPPLKIPTGYVRAAMNYEIDINGGYTGVTGYERYDGRVRPSDATYAILNATITGAFAVGDTLTGLTSGATSVIAAATAGYFVITKITGTYQAAEELQIAAVTIATATGAQTVSGASTAKLHAQYKNAAADIYRLDIAAVPGSGPVLGVVQYNDIVYAIRNNAGGTAAVLHKATASGWSAVSLGRELSFTSGGTYVISEGDTITGATSGATAVITRVVLESGTFAAGTAAGRLIFASQTGTFQSEDLDVGANLNVSTITGDSTAITLTAGGRYEFDIKNFGGQLDTKRVYGCSGVHRGSEFDGTVYVPISTGMNPDTPSHVSVHKKHLMFSFKSSLQHSGIGTPYIWTPISGALELAVGDTINALLRLAGAETGGGSLAVLTKDSTSILYGSSPSDWNLVNYNDELGAIQHTAQNIESKSLMFDVRGLTSLATTANYGNFASATLSQRVQTWLRDKRNITKSSCVNRDKSQYRLFFSDKYALYVTFNAGKIRGMMPIRLDHSVDCIWSGEKIDGTEEIYFGSSDGFVYQMEKGTSFDGADISGYLHLAWNSQKNVRQNKRYKRVMFEISGDGYAEFNFRYELGYKKSDISQPIDVQNAVDFSPVFWDTFIWDQFTWDGSELQPSSMSMEASAENVSLIIANNADYFSPMSFSGAILHFIRRRGLK